MTESNSFRTGVRILDDQHLMNTGKKTLRDDLRLLERKILAVLLMPDSSELVDGFGREMYIRQPV